MQTPFLIGQRIYLRPLKPKDLNKNYLAWLNDPEVNEFLDSCRRPTAKYQLKKYYEQVMDSSTDIMFAIIEKKSARHIGNVRLSKIDWIHREANYGRMIGDKKAWGKGYGVEALRLIMDYAFNTLNLNRLYTPVIEGNIASIKSNVRAGMQREGRARQARFIKGKYLDIIHFAMTKDRYLKMKPKP